MTTIMAKKKKKKGRPSLLDLQKRSIKQQQQLVSQRQNPNSFGISSNPKGSSELVAGDEDDERKEKKHKLVIGFNSKSEEIPSTFSFFDDPERRKIIDVGSNHTSQKVLKVTGNGVVGDGSQVESGPTTPLPDKKLLLFILDRLQKKDTYGVFSEPVDPEELPDYHEIIANPMDFGTVKQKLDSGAYTYLEQFENDIMLICSNAMEYNSSDTVYFRQAKSIQELAIKDFENLREESDDSEPSPPQPKIVRRGRPPGKKNNNNNNKSTETSLFESVGFESFADVTPPFMRDNNSNGSSVYNLRKAPTPNKFRFSDSLNGILPGSFGTDSGPSWVSEWEKEFPTSVLKNVLKYGTKRFSIDENKRATYLSSSDAIEGPSPLTLMHRDQKHLVEVGDPYVEHSYTRSLDQFTAGLGPEIRKIALKKIESILPTDHKLAQGAQTFDAMIQPNNFIQPCFDASNGSHLLYLQPPQMGTFQPESWIGRPSQDEDFVASQVHNQQDSQLFVSSDMNSGCQTPCSPPKQLDLALQLKMGW